MLQNCYTDSWVIFIKHLRSALEVPVKYQCIVVLYCNILVILEAEELISAVGEDWVWGVLEADDKGFPGSPADKESACSAGDPGSIPE